MKLLVKTREINYPNSRKLHKSKLVYKLHPDMKTRQDKHVPVARSQQTLGPQLRRACVLSSEFLRRLDLVLRAARHRTAGSAPGTTLPRVGGSQQTPRYRLLVPKQPRVQDQTILPNKFNLTYFLLTNNMFTI